MLQPFSSNSVAAVYNGEIYNHLELRPFRGSEGLPLGAGDGEVLIPAFEDFGATFPRHLDGEFALALVDRELEIVVLALDAFGTKPLWYGLSSDGLRFAAASYRSALARLDLAQIRPVPPNSILVFTAKEAEPVELIQQFAQFEFDLRQWKSDTRGWEKAFMRAVAQRAGQNRHQFWLGLSSGHDSGAVHCAVELLASAASREGKDKGELQNSTLPPFESFGRKGYSAWMVRAGEWMDYLRDRVEYHGDAHSSGLAFLIQLGQQDYEEHQLIIHNRAEPSSYPLVMDSAAVAMSFIGQRARQLGQLVYISGQGADEVLSDYGFLGVHVNIDKDRIILKRRRHQFFPEDLAQVFPWNNFFRGTMRNFIFKEEVILGVHGIETRYPFLSTRVVQEYLWLTSEAKNRLYKTPVSEFLSRHGYSYKDASKLGFVASQNVDPEASSISLLPMGRPIAKKFWEDLLLKTSGHCLGGNSVPGIREMLLELASKLRRPCALFGDASEWIVAKRIVTWANLLTDFTPHSTECDVNAVAVHFAGLALWSLEGARTVGERGRITSSVSVHFGRNTGRGDPGPLFSTRQLDWVLSMDWSQAGGKLLALVLSLVARAAARAAALVPEVHGDTSLCDQRLEAPEALQRLRDLWQRWPSETSPGTGLPRVLHFLAITEPLWTALDPEGPEEGPPSCPSKAQELCATPEELEPRWEYADLARLGTTHNFSDLEYARGEYSTDGFVSDDTISLVTLFAKGSRPFGVWLTPKDDAPMLQHFEKDEEGWYAAYQLLQTTDSFQINWNESLTDLTIMYQALPCFGLRNTRYVEAIPLRKSYITQTDSPEACCTLCYQETKCETWMWLMDGTGNTGCWLARDVSGIQSDNGIILGRIRASS